jgi:transcriptional antiterminator NusG
VRIDFSQEGDILKRGAPPDIELAWYVIQTCSRHEVKVESALQQKGLEVFLPRVVVPSRRRDRKLLLEVPLFPGYLFVYTDLEPADYYDIIKLKSVVRLLGGTSGPRPLSPETVASIKTIIDSDRPYYPGPYLTRGMKVFIVEGPLAGTVGIIQGRREKKRRLVVSVELFQRAVAVELEDEAVEPWS